MSHWEPRSEHAPNHYFDAEVLTVLAADREGVRYLGEPRPTPTKRPRGPGDGGDDWLGDSQLLDQEEYW